MQRTPSKPNAMQNKRRTSWCLLILAASKFINKRNEIKFFGVTQPRRSSTLRHSLPVLKSNQQFRTSVAQSGSSRFNTLWHRTVSNYTNTIRCAHVWKFDFIVSGQLRKSLGRFSPRRVLLPQYRHAGTRDRIGNSFKSCRHLTHVGSFNVSDRHRALLCADCHPRLLIIKLDAHLSSKQKEKLLKFRNSMDISRARSYQRCQFITSLFFSARWS